MEFGRAIHVQERKKEAEGVRTACVPSRDWVSSRSGTATIPIPESWPQVLRFSVQQAQRSSILVPTLQRQGIDEGIYYF
jgi:hypothetical protein